MTDIPTLKKPTQPAEEAKLFQVGSNRESLATPWILLITTTALLLLSILKMPELTIISFPAMGAFLWIAIVLIKQSRQPWVVAKKSCLEIKIANRVNKTVSLTIPWENIGSFELSRPYKDHLIINLSKPINIPPDEACTTTLIASNRFFDADPDELLERLTVCLGVDNQNKRQPSYVPNYIPIKDRAADILLFIIIVVWGIYSILHNDVALPTKRNVVHLHGLSMWLMLGAFVAGAANFISWVVDHYDQRNNESQYRLFRAYSRTLGYLLFGTSLIVWLTQ